MKDYTDFTPIGQKKFDTLCQREDFIGIDYFYEIGDGMACAILKFKHDNCRIDAFGNVKWGICL